MPELELIIESLADHRILRPDINEDDKIEMKPGGIPDYFEDALVADFRLILTSMPCDYFPITILQNGVKLTNEPPKGIKANMLKCLNDLSEDFLDYEHLKDTTKDQITQKREILKNLMFSLSIYHAVILERRKFGPLGYNILYDFNDSDLETTLKTVKIMIGKYQDVPFNAIKYLTAEINYGGRVTDPWDRRTVSTVLDIFFNEDCLTPEYRYTSSQQYYVPEEASIEDLIQVMAVYPGCKEVPRTRFTHYFRHERQRRDILSNQGEQEGNRHCLEFAGGRTCPEG